MSDPHRSHLPLEILDSIIDLLYDRPEILKQCCLVSKLWVPRTRKYLFADINILTSGDLEAWKKAFPDPSRSPAHHTHTLTIACAPAIMPAGAEEDGWIQTFSSVVSLALDTSQYSGESEISFTPFHQFSTSLRSLRVTSTLLPQSQVFDLIHSLPLLEDLALDGRHVWASNDDEFDGPPTVLPSTSPTFTGTLELILRQGGTGIVRQLLDLLNGLHFRKLKLLWREEEDFRWIVQLVVACSDTLEHVDITRNLNGAVYYVCFPAGSAIYLNFHPQTSSCYQVRSTSPERRNSKTSHSGSVCH